MSDTPQTDAFVNHMAEQFREPSWIEFSQELERENNALRAKVGELERLLVDKGIEIEHLQELLDDNNDMARDI